jgi:hypothetical protein
MNFLRRYGLVAALLVGAASGYAWAATQLGTVGNYQPQHITQAGTSCTISATTTGCGGLSTGDCGLFIDFTAGATVTVTLPNNVTVPGCPVTMQQDGAGLVKFVTATGATLNGFGSFTQSAGQYAIFGVRVMTTGVSTAWTFYGNGAT